MTSLKDHDEQNDGDESSSGSKRRRLEKNRQSARESRKRKKTYIEALEYKLDILKQENTKLRTQLQAIKEHQGMIYQRPMEF
jgi:hypothetical protein